MRRSLFRLLPLLLLAAGGAIAAPAATDVEIVKSEFGVFQDDGSDQLGFGASLEIPLSPGQAYGWLMEVKTSKKSLAVREELSIPKEGSQRPAADDTDPGVTPIVDTVTSFNERRVPVTDGLVFAERKLTSADKPGRYRLRVFVERKLAATFDFELRAALEPAPAERPSVQPASPPGRAKRSVKGKGKPGSK